MCKTSFIFLLLLLCNIAYGQAFITLDNDTGEFIKDVNFSLYKNRKVVYQGTTLPDNITTIRHDVEFDSILFSRVDYNALAVAKSKVDSVIYLSKKTIYLDEVVIGNKDKEEIIIGETNRFVKRWAHTLSKSLDYGLVVVNGSPEKLKLDKLAFYVEKVKVKTAYTINFSEVTETPVQPGFRIANPGKIIYASDTLYLNPKDKNRIEIALPSGFYFPAAKKMFVWIQLTGYYDAAGKEVYPEPEMQTRLKFQLSDKTNYYSRMVSSETNELSRDIINMNLMYNYEYAFRFFKTPHRSSIVAPAILLYAHKVMQ